MLKNGTYAFSVASNDKRYVPSDMSPFTVGSSPVNVPITFSTLTFGVTFTESGLPSGTSWAITLNGTPQSSSTSTITFAETNGTFAFTAGSIVNYSVNPSEGTVTVNGSAAEEAITYVHGGPVPYRVTFKETGLPSGTNWAITLNGTQHTSSSNTIPLSETNGTYRYIATVAAYGGTNRSFEVNGAPLTVTVAFYRVTFTESKLSAAASWSVTTNAATQSSSTTSIIFYEASGNYSYAIGTISGYHAVDHGTYTVSAGSITIHTAFSVTTYKVKFSETGLTPAWKTEWCVTFNGTTVCATAGSISFRGSTNGTYNYSIGHVRNYTLSGPYAGSITVAGGSQGTTSNTITPAWALVKYTATFAESGLARGKTWSLTIDDQTKSSTGRSISIALSNGSYSFTIVAAGYTEGSSPPSPLTVNGAAVSVAVTFAGGSEPGGGPGTTALFEGGARPAAQSYST